MRNVLPNPFLQNAESDKGEFELDAAAFLEALEAGVVPKNDDQIEDAPSVAATYPLEFETYDLEELAGLVNPNRWRRDPRTSNPKKRER